MSYVTKHGHKKVSHNINRLSKDNDVHPNQVTKNNDLL